LQAENQGLRRLLAKLMSVMTELASSFQEGKILLLDKPYGWTSFDLVRKVRNTIHRRFNLKKLKIGHAGTLDPLATGLMILCTGKATKRIESLQAGEKEYLATIKFGATTPSYDRETGEDKMFPTLHITKSLLMDTLCQFTGNIMQVPPAFSAIKIDGKRAYEFARNGNTPELKAREIVINVIELVVMEMPMVKLRIVCSKGTYIRSLAHDIGKSLNTGAYLTDLRRIRSGEYTIENAITLEEFLQNIKTSEIQMEVK
jgi:tRNA pseudouridine55 synthase